MCSNYQAVTSLDRLLSFFGVAPSGDLDLAKEVYPLRLAPFIRLKEDGSGAKVIEAGQFGLLPNFATELQYGRKTYNARCETIDTLPSFRAAWAAARRCIIPVEALFEMFYDGDNPPERWCIYQQGNIPMGVAGLYLLSPTLKDKNGNPLWSFTMITCNCDSHPFYRRFHGPNEEKRMPVILEPAEYERWLLCPPSEAKTMCVPWFGALEAYAAPRAPKPISSKVPKPGINAKPAKESKPPKPPKPQPESPPPDPQQPLF